MKFSFILLIMISVNVYSTINIESATLTKNEKFYTKRVNRLSHAHDVEYFISQKLASELNRTDINTIIFKADPSFFNNYFYEKQRKALHNNMAFYKANDYKLRITYQCTNMEKRILVTDLNDNKDVALDCQDFSSTSIYPPRNKHIIPKIVGGVVVGGVLCLAFIAECPVAVPALALVGVGAYAAKKTKKVASVCLRAVELGCTACAVNEVIVRHSEH